jgi:hypothetical protein
MRILQPISVVGLFWTAARPEQKLHGTLEVSNGGDIILTIIGNFDSDLESINELQIGRVGGVVEKGKYVTLENCLYKNKTLSFGSGISRSTIFAHYAYWGIALDAGETAKWHNVRLSFDGLDEWHGLTGIKVECDFEARACDISYRPISDLVLWKEQGVEIKLIFSWSVPGWPANTEAKITQKSYLKVSFDSEQPIEEFWRFIRMLNTFFCFATDKVVSVQEVSLSNNKLTEGTQKQYPKSFKHYYRSTLFDEKPPDVFRPFILISHPQIKDKSQEIFARWFKAHEVITPSLNLYFSAQANVFRFIDGRFLALAQCLETYHRRTSDAKQLPQEEFDKLYKALSDAAPEEFKKLVQNKLKHWNEPTLTKRLELMLSRFGNLFGAKKQRDVLAWKISNTRNYLTHYSEHLEEAATHDGGDLWRLCQKMEALFQLYLLQELGFEDVEIQEIAKTSQGLIPKLNDNLEPLIKVGRNSDMKGKDQRNADQGPESMG